MKIGTTKWRKLGGNSSTPDGATWSGSGMRLRVYAVGEDYRAVITSGGIEIGCGLAPNKTDRGMAVLAMQDAGLSVA